MAAPSSVRVCETDLIKHVRQYPHLYDTRHKDYKDLRKCAVTWAEIARSLGCPEAWKACKERWRTLRDVYVRNKKSVMVGDKEGRPRWRFFDQMQFLNSYIIHKPTDNDLNASKWVVAAADVETVLCEDDTAILSLPFETHHPDEDEDTTSNPAPPSSTASEDSLLTPGIRIKEEAVEWVEEEVVETPDLKLEVEEEGEEEEGEDQEVDKEKKKKKKAKEQDDEKGRVNGHHYEDPVALYLPLPSRKRRRHHTPVHSPGTPPSSSASSPSPSTTRLTIASDSLLFPTPNPVRTPPPTTPHEDAKPPRRAPALPPQVFVPHEEEELFGSYVAAAIRKLSAKAKSLAKMKIQRVLFEIEEWDR
ncbi:uncharacterized protein DDB_G0284459-like [Penaeus chinensis]|uniref:uncharacterized protein DDB_G0284459-like n=1 Tax=Penaeus chinensis TaxID=139456 RepID=UPI001FB58333|nr:uncharacterized protein DDB_G0284459-like [Penaeus chinensis]